MKLVYIADNHRESLGPKERVQVAITRETWQKFMEFTKQHGHQFANTKNWYLADMAVAAGIEAIEKQLAA